MTLETEEEVQSNENKVSDYGVFLFFFFSSSDCESLTFSRWNMVEPGEFTTDSLRSGSLPSRSVPLWLCVCLPTPCPREGDEVDPISLFQFCCFVFSSWWCPISRCCSSPTVSCSVLCLKCNLPQYATHVGISYPCIVNVLNFIHPIRGLIAFSDSEFCFCN